VCNGSAAALANVRKFDGTDFNEVRTSPALRERPRSNAERRRCDGDATAMRRRCDGDATAMQWRRCYGDATAMQLRCNRTEPHVCMYVNARYRQIHTDMHCFQECTCACIQANNTCKYIHMCIANEQCICECMIRHMCMYVHNIQAHVHSIQPLRAKILTHTAKYSQIQQCAYHIYFVHHDMSYALCCIQRYMCDV